MSRNEIESYIIKNSNGHVTGTQLYFLAQGFEMALKMIEQKKDEKKKNEK